MLELAVNLLLLYLVLMLLKLLLGVVIWHILNAWINACEISFTCNWENAAWIVLMGLNQRVNITTCSCNCRF